MYLKIYDEKKALPVILGVYGLGLYHYYVCRTAVVSYYTVCVPFILLAAYWFNEWLKGRDDSRRRSIVFLLLILTLGGLLTNQNFLRYPNLLNITQNRYELEKKYRDQNFVDPRDAQMIAKYTRPQQRVCLISSYETAWLMAADRKPLFYYFPLIESAPLRADLFVGTYVFTKDRMRQTLDEMARAESPYVFVEKKLYDGLLSKKYYQYFQTMSFLMQDLHRNYQPVAEGNFLMVLKRKPH